MESVARIIGSHPRVEQSDPAIAALVSELSECESVCIVCADACLTEPDVGMLARCIALNESCADVCAGTRRTLSRIGNQEATVLRRQLEACREVTILCAEECERHEHEHCRICAVSCRSSEKACSAALQGMLTMV